MHISASSVDHEQVILPTKAMHPGEEDYAIACAVPVNARGVIDHRHDVRAARGGRSPLPGERQGQLPEGFVVFDNVFVPNERIFLDGETAARRRPRALARTVGARGRTRRRRRSADREVGMAALLAEANGVGNDPHIKDPLGIARRLLDDVQGSRRSGDGRTPRRTKTAS